MTRLEWRERAACRGMNVDIFVGTNTVRTRHPDYTTARAVCAACPVTRECLAEAGSSTGMWGGLDEAERLGHRRTHRVTAEDQVLAALTKPMSTAQIADATRLSVTTVRAALNALRERRAVTAARHAGTPVWTAR